VPPPATRVEHLGREPREEGLMSQVDGAGVREVVELDEEGRIGARGLPEHGVQVHLLPCELVTQDVFDPLALL